MNKDLLRSIMVLFGDTIASLAEYLEISEQKDNLLKSLDEIEKIIFDYCCCCICSFF